MNTPPLAQFVYSNTWYFIVFHMNVDSRTIDPLLVYDVNNIEHKNY